MIAKQIVLQFDGDITCESEVEVGSTFTFSFKLEDHVILEPESEEG
jgi:signal transduction histidine kinase